MAYTREYLTQLLEQIRDERQTAANTATRIGRALLALLDYAADGLTWFRELIHTSGISNRGDISNEGDITNTGTITTQHLAVLGKATFLSIEVAQVRAAGGMLVESPGTFRADLVAETDADGRPLAHPNQDRGGAVEPCLRLYQLAQDADGRQLHQELQAGDQLLCQTFNVADLSAAGGAQNRYWWRRVLAVGSAPVTLAGEDGQEHQYLWADVSLADGADASQRPEAGDEASVVGHSWGTLTDAARQGANVTSAYNTIDTGLVAPFWAQYHGIGDYTLAPHRGTYFAQNGNRIVGTVEMTTGSTVAGKGNLSDWMARTTNTIDRLAQARGQSDRQVTIWFKECRECRTSVLAMPLHRNYRLELPELPALPELPELPALPALLDNAYERDYR